MIDEIIKGMVRFFGDLFSNAINWASQFQQLGSYSTKALEQALAQTARTCGLLSLSGLHQLQSAGESLQLLVRATTLNLPNPETNAALMRLALAEYRTLRRALWGAKA